MGCDLSLNPRCGGFFKVSRLGEKDKEQAVLYADLIAEIGWLVGYSIHIPTGTMELWNNPTGLLRC